MEALSDITIYLTLFFATLLLIGIIRPDFVLFWTDNKSRGKVLAIFGSLAFITFIIWSITSSQRSDGFKSQTSPRDSTFRENTR
jgi:hypothetical protein